MMNGEVSAQYWAFGIYFFVGMGICLLMIMLAALLGGEHLDEPRTNPLNRGLIQLVQLACVFCQVLSGGHVFCHLRC